MKSNLKNNKGVTLIELILSLGLLGLVISLSFNFLLSTIRLPDKAKDEYDIQHEMRMTFEKITRVTRDASATFILHKKETDERSEEWNYIMPSLDNTSLIEYRWNSDTSEHDRIIIAEPKDGVTYTLAFDKISEPYEDNLLQYTIIVNFNGKDETLVSETEALNSLQVIDRGKRNETFEQANSLAYRTDPRPAEVTNEKAMVTFVLDKSGSMEDTMRGGSSDDNSGDSDDHSRMKKLRIEAKRFINNLSNDKNSSNIYVSIVPFSSTANSNSGSYAKMQVESNSEDIKAAIDTLSPSGGTNTGDGIRRGYYTIEEFGHENTDWKINNFMIILVDGVTTFYSAHRVNSPGNDESDYTFVTGSNNIDDEALYYYNFWGSKRYYYNTYFPQGRYGGLGNILDDYGEDYVDDMGAMVQSYRTPAPENKKITVYVIAFSSRPGDDASLARIASATGAENVYSAGDSEALESIFDSIQKDISEQWHIGGPK